MRLSIIIIIIFIFCGVTSASTLDNSISEDLKKYYDECGLNGTFVLYDQAKEQYIIYNDGLSEVMYTPASTFKILNSMIGLETEAIPDVNYVIQWDSISRNQYWDKNHDMTSAYKYSVVWYYQELARRVGKNEMQFWLDKVNYGNNFIGNKVDNLWLNGDLKISAFDQVKFLKKVKAGDLPFSNNTLEKVKNIMIEKSNENYVLRTKTGWGNQGEDDIGWYIGYLELKGNTYYFANCIIKNSNSIDSNEDAIQFDKCRKTIVYKILNYLGIIDLQE